jgi:hypothetical protein
MASVLTVLVAIGAYAAIAQDLKVQVPFDFYAAGKLFPAGTYVLSKATPANIQLRDSGGRSVFIATGFEKAKMSDQSWVRFSRYGNRNFLRGAYWSGSGVSLQAPASRAERETAKVAARELPITIAAE